MSDGKQVVILRPRGFVYAEIVRELGEVLSMVGGLHDYSMIKFRHVRVVDENDESIPCDACSKTFATRMGYEMHLIGRIHPTSPQYDPEGRTKLPRNEPTLVTPLVGVSAGDEARLKAKDVPIY